MHSKDCLALKNWLLKMFDRLAGVVFTRCLRSASVRTTIRTPQYFLLVRPGGIGDAVLLTPVINAINKFYPDCHITILAERRNCGVFSFVPKVSKVLCYDSPMDLVQAMLSRYDVVIDTEQWHRLSAVVSRLVQSPIKIGFDTNERRRMFTHTLHYSHEEYETVSFAHLLEPLGIKLGIMDFGAPFLTISDESSDKAGTLLEPLSNEPFVTIFPSASIAERRWGVDRFHRVAEILSAFGIKVVVVGGKEDHRQGEVVVGGGLGLNLAGLTSLPETAAVLQKSSLLLSGDSGVLHIAVGFGIPTVSLFGPGRASKWAPRGDRHIVINKNLPCSPCTTFGNTPRCPINNKCMRDITVDEVVNSVTMLLTSVGTMPSKCCKRDWIEMA